jgi:biopolymer transport protein ExbD
MYQEQCPDSPKGRHYHNHIVVEKLPCCVLYINPLMTEINTTVTDRRRPGVRKSKRHNLRTDMTPMVDLGFILITFFVMTVQLSKPVAVKLNMPKEGPPIKLGESSALTVLLDDNKIYYYHGDWKEAATRKEIYATNFSEMGGLGKVIREKQKWLDLHEKKEGRKGLMLLIKPGSNASYKNVIDALDETMINAVKKYAIVSIDPVEADWMKKQP